jgi:transcriptional regulator with XRE-family HTH domain
MNKKQLKMCLRQIGNDGWFAVKITNEFVDSFLLTVPYPPPEELKQYFLSRLHVRMQDAAIKKAYRAADPAVVPFGRFIQSIRENANLTTSEIGNRLRKEEKFVQQVENGKVSLLRLPATDVADLRVLFQIKIKHAFQLVNASLEKEAEKEAQAFLTSLRSEFARRRKVGQLN